MEESTLKNIYQSVLKFLMPLSSEETFEMVVQEGIRLNKAHFGSLVLEQGGEFTEVFSTLPIRLKRARKGSTYKAYKEGKSYVIYHEDFAHKYPGLVDLGIQSNVFIPLSYKRKSIGVLIINSQKKARYTKDQLDAYDLFGSLASLVIKKTQLYNETKDALNLRDKFISLAAHELRTPLTAVRGYIQLLLSRSKGFDSKEAGWLEQLSYESIRLQNLINELLEINKVRSGQLDYFWKAYGVKQIVERALNNFKFAHPEYEIQLTDQIKENEDSVIGDFDKLLQSFTNLLDNAAKYSLPEKPIEILMLSTTHYLEVVIKDKGQGISQEDLSHIGHSFYKNPNNTKSGLGLGLYFSKEIIQKHHGQLKIKSKEGKGTEIVIRLPKT